MVTVSPVTGHGDRARRGGFVATTLAILAVLLLPAGAVTSAAASSELQGALDAVVDTGIPGAVAVSRGYGSVRRLTAGTSVLGEDRPIRQHDSFRIASIAKTFSAVLTLQLVDSGRIDLDDTVEKWLPGLLKHGKRITVAQLMQHTSGLPDYVKDEAFLDEFVADLTARWHPREVLSFVAEKPLHFKPGTKYEYSDSDNIVLGLLVKRVTHGSYTQALRRGILRPVGMPDTSLPHDTALSRPFVHGYQFEDGKGKGELIDSTKAVTPSAAWASGGMVSTLSDLTKFWRALLRGRLISPDLLDVMVTDLVEGGGSPLGPGRNQSGLGIFAWTMRCGTLYGHTGSFPGYQTFSGATRDGSVSVVVMANATSPSQRGTRAQTRAYREAACAAIRAG